MSERIPHSGIYPAPCAKGNFFLMGQRLKIVCEMSQNFLEVREEKKKLVWRLKFFFFFFFFGGGVQKRISGGFGREIFFVCDLNFYLG